MYVLQGLGTCVLEWLSIQELQEFHTPVLTKK